MVKVEFFGLYRLDLGVAELSVEAKSIKEVFEILEKQFMKYTAEEFMNSIVLVNGVNFLKLKKSRTKLNEGDTVFIMSPASGG
ncbi:MAG: MoaD/ThiS family protein [Christensenellales bacterium]|jgi:molybdopterin converting factor small subunit